MELKKYLQYSKFDSGLASVLTAIAQGSILIQKKISRLSLEGLEGSTGTKNIQNEDVKKLDILANDIFLEKFQESKNVAMVGCEELEKPQIFNNSISKFLTSKIEFQLDQAFFFLGIRSSSSCRMAIFFL